MADVPLVGPDGAPYAVDSSELDQALRAGFKEKLEPQEQAPETTGEKFARAGAGLTDVLGTGAAGVLQGLTGGAFGAALGSDDNNRVAADYYKKAQTEHPWAHGAGELAGALASPLNEVGGGISEALAPTSALGRIGTSGLGGSAVAGMFGAGNALSEEMLGDHQLNAEKLVAGAGLGAILGGAGGLLGGALSEAASPVLSKLSDFADDAKGKLNEFANNRALKAAGAIQKDFKKMTPEEQQAIGQMLMDRGHVTSATRLGDAADSIEKDLEAQGQKIGNIMKDAEANGAKPDFTQFQKRLSDLGGSLNPLERNSIAPELRATSEALQELEAKGGSFTSLNDLKGTLQAKAKWIPGEDSVAGGLKRQLAGTFRDELDSQLLPQLGSDTAKEFTDTKELYGQLSKAQRFASDAANRRLGNRAVSLTDYMSGGIAGGIGSALGIPHGIGLSILGAITNKAAREYGSSVAATLARGIADSPGLSTVAKSFSSQLSSLMPKLGAFGPILAEAAGQGPASALAQHMALAASDPEYQHQAQMAGLVPEGTGQTDAMLARAHGLAQLGVSLSAHDSDLDRMVGQALAGGREPHSPMAVYGKQDFGNQRMRRDNAEAYQQRADEVRGLASNPEALASRVAGNLGQLSQAAPATATQTAAIAQRATQYLASVLPKQPPQTPLGPKWTPSEAEMHSFSVALEAVHDPHSVLKHMGAGTLTPQAVQALKAVYPKLEQQMTTRLLDQAISKRDVPYSQKVMLSLWTGQDLDGSMSPGAIARNQAISQAPSQKSPQSGGPSKPTAKGTKNLSIAQRTATPSAARESDRD